MNTQRENMRRVMQDVNGEGENATPLGYASSQKSSQSSTTSSQGGGGGLKSSSLLNQGAKSSFGGSGGLSNSKKINLTSQLKPLNEGRKIFTDKSNKGIHLASSSSNKYNNNNNNNNNTTIKQLERQETNTQVFVDKKAVSSSSTTVKIESTQATQATQATYKDTLSASSLINNSKESLQQQSKATATLSTSTATDEFFSDNNNNNNNKNEQSSEEEIVPIVPVLPIVVPKHLRHLYTKGGNKTTSLLPQKRFLSSLLATEQDNDQENQDPALYEKKLKSSHTQVIHLPTTTTTATAVTTTATTTTALKELFVPNAPALDLVLSKETENYDNQQELKARQAMIQTTDNLKLHQWNDPMMVAEYAGEIFGYLYDSEPNLMANATYAYNCQHEVTWKMRSVLIDWVIEIHYLFQLLPETLFLAVNIIDRFLSERTVVLGKLQLVGITSLFIATKFEEMSCPTMQDFLFMTDNAVKEDELIKAERFILQVLDFQLCYPNPMNFLRRICTDELKCDVHTRTLAKYFMEISCIDHQFIGIRPSKIAAAALWLSKKMLAKGKWNHHYSKVCGYAPDDLKPVVESMLDYLSQPVTHDAFFKKWSSTKLSKASIFVRDWINRYYIN